jgi:hypothetical protein
MHHGTTTIIEALRSWGRVAKTAAVRSSSRELACLFACLYDYP